MTWPSAGASCLQAVSGLGFLARARGTGRRDSARARASAGLVAATLRARASDRRLDLERSVRLAPGQAWAARLVFVLALVWGLRRGQRRRGGRREVLGVSFGWVERSLCG